VSTLLSRSQLSLTRSQGILCWFDLGYCWGGGREEQHALGHAAAADNFWEEEGSPSLSSLYLYSTLNEVGVFGVGLNVFLSLFWSLQKPVLPLPPSSLRQFKNCVAADLEISSENCVPADFWQRKTASLPIQEIGSATADSEIDSENCVAVDSGNQQPKLRCC